MPLKVGDPGCADRGPPERGLVLLVGPWSPHLVRMLLCSVTPHLLLEVLALKGCCPSFYSCFCLAQCAC